MKLGTFALGALLLPALTIGQASAQTTTLHGTVVDYLSAVGATGGIVASTGGTGGITVNSRNAGIYTHGSSQLVRPLGLKTNGTVYLLDVSQKHGNVATTLASDKGKSVSVKGETVRRDGTNILMVRSASLR